MIPREIEVRVYQAPDGRSPFNDWLARLRDFRAIEKIDARIARLRSGHFGRQGRAIVLLLCAGDKATQPRDIARAQRYWRDHTNANHPLS